MYIKLFYSLFSISYIYAISSLYIALLFKETITMVCFFYMLVSMTILVLTGCKSLGTNKSRILKTLLYIIFIIFSIAIAVLIDSLVAKLHYMVMLLLAIIIHHNANDKITHEKILSKFNIGLCFYIFSYFFQLLGREFLKIDINIANNSVLMFIVNLLIANFLIRMLRDEKYTEINRRYITKSFVMILLFVVFISILVYYGGFVLIFNILIFILRFIFVSVTAIISFIYALIAHKRVKMPENYQLKMLFEKIQDTIQSNPKGFEQDVIANRQYMSIALIIILVLALGCVICYVIRKISGHKANYSCCNTIEIERRKIEEVDKGIKKINRSMADINRSRIRHNYRLFIKQCSSKDIQINIDDTTCDISEKYKNRFSQSSEFENQLRDKYIKARYNTKENITKEDVKISKELLRKL